MPAELRVGQACKKIDGFDFEPNRDSGMTGLPGGTTDLQLLADYCAANQPAYKAFNTWGLVKFKLQPKDAWISNFDAGDLCAGLYVYARNTSTGESLQQAHDGLQRTRQSIAAHLTTTQFMHCTGNC